jgi:CheY-like chemotaxis protein
VARFLNQAMTEAGYAPQPVDDGLDALEMARSGDFDLILLEVMLPRMDGFEICRRLRAANIPTPILLITARDLLADKVSCSSRSTGPIGHAAPGRAATGSGWRSAGPSRRPTAGSSTSGRRPRACA